MKRPIVSVWPIDPEPSGRLRLGESRLPQFPLGILPTGIGKDVAAAPGHQGEGRRFLDDPFRRWQTKHSGISNSAPAPLHGREHRRTQAERIEILSPFYRK